jgi:hypothetical protein
VFFDRRQGEQRGMAVPRIRLQENRRAVRCDRRSPTPSPCIVKQGRRRGARSSALRGSLLRTSRAVACISQHANAANKSIATSNSTTIPNRVIGMTGSGAKPQDGQSGVEHPAQTAIWPGSCSSDFMAQPAEVVKGTLCLQ